MTHKLSCSMLRYVGLKLMIQPSGLWLLNIALISVTSYVQIMVNFHLKRYMLAPSAHLQDSSMPVLGAALLMLWNLSCAMAARFQNGNQSHNKVNLSTFHKPMPVGLGWSVTFKPIQSLLNFIASMMLNSKLFMLPIVTLCLNSLNFYWRVLSNVPWPWSKSTSFRWMPLSRRTST